MSRPEPELVGGQVEAASQAPAPPPSVMASRPVVAPYHPPPAHPPRLGPAAPTNGRAIVSLAVAAVAIALGLPFGVPGLVLGPVAYFTGKTAISHVDDAQGAVGGRGLAAAGWVLGVVATAIGAVVSLVWLVVLLVYVSGPTP